LEKPPSRVKGPVPAQFAPKPEPPPKPPKRAPVSGPCKRCKDVGFVMARIDRARHQQPTARPSQLVSHGLFCPDRPPELMSNFGSMLERVSVFGVEEVPCPLCALRAGKKVNSDQ
jgi:hypothetical protein